MITVDQTQLNRDLARWGAGVARYVDALGVSAGTVVRRQAGLLSRELIDISPKAKAEKIKAKVDQRFHAIANVTDHGNGGGKESNGVIWYNFSSHSASGIKAEADKTKASVDELKKIFLNSTKSGKLKVGRRGKQAFYIWQKMTTKKATRDKLAMLIISHIGRLASGWLVSWSGLGSHGKNIPQKVLRHQSDANSRGFLIDSSSAKDMPSVTIGNNARGVQNLTKRAGALVRLALQRRSFSMKKDLEFALRNRGKWMKREGYE